MEIGKQKKKFYKAQNVILRTVDKKSSHWKDI